jgi:hypothetical protein
MKAKWVKKSVKDFPAPFTVSHDKDKRGRNEYSEYDLWLYMNWIPYELTDSYYTDGRFLIIKERSEAHVDGRALGWRVFDMRYKINYPVEPYLTKTNLTPHYIGKDVYKIIFLRSSWREQEDYLPLKDANSFYQDIIIPLEKATIKTSKFSTFFMTYASTQGGAFVMSKKENQWSFDRLQGAKNFVKRLLKAERESFVYGIVNTTNFTLDVNEVNGWIYEQVD